ncbi:diguanylate cyclase [Tissierella sp. Yu-01]|uniref:diguanylate cyclase n=1 Tax=Tissierella sp. Yu-01 TaxID=3035694 RepID=UPI00240D9589|nr:diguanylate cyclase [Tissierella sp. Yu-01]WFA07946.1 diguanylate cyclase [Tissierella sp. Yu-01]
MTKGTRRISIPISNIKYKSILKEGLLSNILLNRFRIKDSITGVATLSFVMEYGQMMVDTGQNVTALVIGIDNFRHFNEKYGHLVANDVLVKFGKALGHKTANLNSIVGRLGGDEFILIIKDLPILHEKSISEEIYSLMFDDTYNIETIKDPIKIEFSIGESFSTKEFSLSITQLIQKAEANLYYEKYKKRISNKIVNEDIFHNQGDQLLKVLAEKDMYTYVHSQSTAKYAVSLAEALKLPSKEIEQIYLAGWLHDIGKIIISSDILRKPYKLDNEEYSIIKEHVINGLNIIRNYDFPDVIKNAILYHHERWDGNGYPFGIKGDDTPIEGRILQITDAFSAMTVKRVYRQQMSVDSALEEIKSNIGTQFDPDIAKIFIDLVKSRKAAI